jgi:hypothetical protein
LPGTASEQTAPAGPPTTRRRHGGGDKRRICGADDDGARQARSAGQVDVLAAFVAAGGSVPEAAARVGVRPSTAKRHLADLRARSGLTTEQLIYRGRPEGWLVVPSLESG